MKVWPCLCSTAPNLPQLISSVTTPMRAKLGAHTARAVAEAETDGTRLGRDLGQTPGLCALPSPAPSLWGAEESQGPVLALRWLCFFIKGRKIRHTRCKYMTWIYRFKKMING